MFTIDCNKYQHRKPLCTVNPFASSPSQVVFHDLYNTVRLQHVQNTSDLLPKHGFRLDLMVQCTLWVPLTGKLYFKTHVNTDTNGSWTTVWIDVNAKLRWHKLRPCYGMCPVTLRVTSLPNLYWLTYTLSKSYTYYDQQNEFSRRTSAENTSMELFYDR